MYSTLGDVGNNSKLFSCPDLIYSRILSSCVLPEAVTQSTGWLLETLSAAEHVWQTVHDIWENMKQDFKPFPYSHEHREPIINAAH